MLLATFAASIAGCTMQLNATGPQYVPESDALAAPEPKIPQQWFGCWDGTFDQYDSATSFIAGASNSDLQAMKTKYQFCFYPGPGGTGRLDLAKAEIAGNQATVTHFENRVTEVDPKLNQGHLRNHFIVETGVNVMWLFPLRITQDIYAEEDFEMRSPDLAFVQGKQVIVIGEHIGAKMTFHADFHRVK